MRKVILLFLFIPGMVCAQIVCEDFESGSGSAWLQNGQGRWEIDSLFPVSGNYSLHHSYDNSEQGCDQTGIRINGLQPSMSESVWEFKIRHAYNPSSSNNWSFFLMSDSPPAEMKDGGAVSGYALGVNLSGYDDTLSLWKIVNGDVSELFSTLVNWQDDIGVDSTASLSVTRDVGGFWNVFIYDGQQDVNIGSGWDEELFYTAWTGIMYNYSSSQDRKIWLDDIVIEGYIEEDHSAPVVDTAYFTADNNLCLAFDEPLAGMPGTENFILMPGEHIPEKISMDGNYYLLEFDRALENKVYYSLRLSGICDMPGNCSDTIIDNILLAWPEWGDIVISEIMFDPDPPVSLPCCQYLELYNLSEFEFNAGELELEAGDRLYELSESLIKPGDYLIISGEDDMHDFSAYGMVTGTHAQLNLKSHELVVLRNSRDDVLHGLEYDRDWYKNSLKKDGGWSLEMIDTAYPFAGRGNWTGSDDSNGGTPGEINSVTNSNPDIDEPSLTNIYPLSASLLHLDFSESMDGGLTENVNWSVEGNSIQDISLCDPLRRAVNIELADSLKSGTIYKAELQGEIADQAGNSLVINDDRFGIPEATGHMDLIINELLFDPLPGDAEYIELYNNSDKIIDLADHFLVSYNKERGDTGRICWLSDECRCLMPGDYYVITTDRQSVIEGYGSCDRDRIFEPGYLPSMPDREGSLILFNRSLVLMDEMSYSGDMHFSMLAVTTGVSLERIDPSVQGTDSNNWRSAAGMAGYGTPGLRNSASPEEGESGGGTSISLSSRKISPDNDGFEDFLRIELSAEGEQNIITITIFDDMGYPVRRLADNMTASGCSVINWDGCDDNANILKEGIYIIYVQIIAPGRPPEVLKKVCALVYY
ncbi:MAG: lamin tail domain-containing protein [Bacteroidales bacterium]|nr:lamin tail domain-containing protein [Bacteroidales bacterium]